MGGRAIERVIILLLLTIRIILFISSFAFGIQTTTVSNSTQQLSRPEDAQTTEETTTSTTTGPKVNKVDELVHLLGEIIIKLTFALHSFLYLQPGYSLC